MNLGRRSLEGIWLTALACERRGSGAAGCGDNLTGNKSRCGTWSTGRKLVAAAGFKVWAKPCCSRSNIPSVPVCLCRETDGRLADPLPGNPGARAAARHDETITCPDCFDAEIVADEVDAAFEQAHEHVVRRGLQLVADGFAGPYAGVELLLLVGLDAKVAFLQVSGTKKLWREMVRRRKLRRRGAGRDGKASDVVQRVSVLLWLNAIGRATRPSSAP